MCHSSLRRSSINQEILLPLLLRSSRSGARLTAAACKCFKLQLCLVFFFVVGRWIQDCFIPDLSNNFFLVFFFRTRRRGISVVEWFLNLVIHFSTLKILQFIHPCSKLFASKIFSFVWKVWEIKNSWLQWRSWQRKSQLKPKIYYFLNLALIYSVNSLLENWQIFHWKLKFFSHFWESTIVSDNEKV